MSHKNQLGVALAVVGVLAFAIWSLANNSNAPSENIISTPSTPVPNSDAPVSEITDESVVFINPKYSDEIKNYLDTLVINGGATSSETLKETVVTYTNKEGQQVEVTASAGAKGIDIAPAN